MGAVLTARAAGAKLPAVSSQDAGWLSVESGLPDEPDSSDWEAICSTPGPSTFLERLFQSAAGVGLSKGDARTESVDTVDEKEVSKGRCGGEKSGYLFTETRSRESSMFDMRLSWETYGLPGMEIRWEFSLEKAGQLGYCAFRNGTLQVRFDGGKARERFEAVWREVFGRAPVLGPVSGGSASPR